MGGTSAGLSKYRDGLYPLQPTKEDACATIDMIEGWQKKIFAEHGIHFIHASDEFYILAEENFRKKNVMMAIYSWKMA